MWPSSGCCVRTGAMTFPHDVVAGLVLGIVTIPQAIAYAFLAGLPAQAGLYACLAPMVIYAALGSSRQLVVGPVAIAALMVAAAVGEHAAAYSDQYLAIVTVLSLQVGILLWVLRAVQLGGIVNLLSHPVISGFVNAAAILIIVSQLGAFTGIDVPADGGAVAQLATLVGSLGHARRRCPGAGPGEPGRAGPRGPVCARHRPCQVHRSSDRPRRPRVGCRRRHRGGGRAGFGCRDRRFRAGRIAESDRPLGRSRTLVGPRAQRPADRFGRLRGELYGGHDLGGAQEGTPRQQP